MVKHQRSLFREKVIVCKESIEEITSDCFINFCCPNILSGTQSFKRIHDLAGPELARACERFLHIFPTSSRVTPSFLATNFKFIVHTVVPNPLDFNRLIDMKRVYICIRNSLELAVEEGAKTIAFPCHFPGINPRIACELILRIFTVWIHRCKYSDELTEIKIMCSLEPIFHQFVHSARSLYEEANTIGHKFVSAFAHQRAAYMHNRKLVRPRRHRRLYAVPPPDAPQVRLELSAKLAPTILVLDDENGMKRQYRLTNRSRDGRKLYFRCSRCDTLIKKDGHQVGIRAKLIVEDGQIVSERFPQHHPRCVAKPVEEVLVQQVDRTSRREVKDGYLLPQDAYRKALDRMRFEARQLGMPVEECFPEWPKLRQQYCRIRKQAVRERMQRNWELMMMMNGGGDESVMDNVDGQQQYYDAGAFFGQLPPMVEEDHSFYDVNPQRFRRHSPRLRRHASHIQSQPDATVRNEHNGRGVLVPRVRYSPTYGGVVVSYDEEEERLGGSVEPPIVDQRQGEEEEVEVEQDQALQQQQENESMGKGERRHNKWQMLQQQRQQQQQRYGMNGAGSEMSAENEEVEVNLTEDIDMNVDVEGNNGGGNAR